MEIKRKVKQLLKLPPVLTILSLSLTTNIYAQETTVLDVIDINEQLQDTSYNAAPSIGAKSSLPSIELPKSVSVINAQVIEDLNATRVDDLYEYVGGVSRKENHGGIWDGIIMRGFSNGANALINGFAAGRGNSNLPRDLANVEQVEFLKGASGSLYGTGEPGGVINIITKKPHFDHATKLDVQADNYGYQRAGLDVNTPISEQSAYRLNFAVEEKDSFRDHVSSNRYIFAPSIVHELGDNSNIEYSAEYVKYSAVIDRGIVMVGDDLKAVNKKTFLGEPEDGDLVTSNLTHQLKFNSAMNDTWRYTTGISYRKNDMYGFNTSPHTGANSLDNNGNLKRSIQLRDYHSKDTTFMAEFYANLEGANIKHELLLGVEKWHLKLNNLWGGSNVALNPYPINIYNPVYGGARLNITSNSYTWDTQNNNAIYVQDTISLSAKWRLIAATRFDDFHKF